MNIENRVEEFELEICSILAQLSYHIHPKIIELIKVRNIEEYEYYRKLFLK